jgi:hypothetical protein
MRFDVIAFYGGPDQVMTVTSGIAGVVGILLIFWNKLVGAVMKIFHRSSEASTPNNVAAPKAPDPPPQNPS